MTNLKKHPFFSEISWDKVKSKEAGRPIDVDIQISNFDKKYSGQQSIGIDFDKEREIPHHNGGRLAAHIHSYKKRFRTDSDVKMQNPFKVKKA